MPNGVLAGSRVDGTDWLLPVVVTGHGNGGNVITAAAFTVLPTTTCTAAITNPHPTAPLLVLCTFGAWLTSVAGSDVRCCPNVTGSVSISAGIGCGGPIGWGEIPIRTEANKGHHAGVATYALPPSATAATFSMWALRTGSGAVNCDFPVIRLIPIRYLF